MDAQLQSEARILAGLSHPNIVTVYELVESGDQVLLVEEWVEGRSLSAVGRAARLSARQAVGVVGGALAGLAFVHARGIVHGDVSPSNILLDLSGVSKLVDFGLAAPSGVAGVAGTPGFLSPQVVKGFPLTSQDDVYSAAAVLAMLLLGRPLFTGSTAEAVVASQLTTDEPELGDIQRHVRVVLRRALSADRAVRYADAGAFQVALEEAAEQDFGAGWLAQASVAGIVSGLVGAGGTAVVAGGTSTVAGVAVPASEPVAPAGTSQPAAQQHARVGASAKSAHRVRRVGAKGIRVGGRQVGAGGLTIAAAVVAVVAVVVAAVLIGARSKTVAAPRAAPSGAPAAALTKTTPSALNNTSTGRSAATPNTTSEIGASPPPTPSTGTSFSTTKTAPAAAKPVVLSWGSSIFIDSGRTLAAVSCPSTTFCMAVDGSGYAVTFNGAKWSTPVLVDSDTNNFFQSVSCPSALFCMASDDSGNVFMFNGKSWGPPKNLDPDDANDPLAVSCASSAFCLVTSREYVGVNYVYDGATWKALESNGIGGEPSCALPAFCGDVGPVQHDPVDAGGGYIYNAGRVTFYPQITRIGGLSTASCPSAGLCIALGGGGSTAATAAFTYAGGHWSAPKLIDPSGSVASISCSAADFCSAVGGQKAVAFTNGHWSAPVVTDPGGALTGVSCATRSFCIAIDQSGRALQWGTATAGPTSTTVIDRSGGAGQTARTVAGSGAVSAPCPDSATLTPILRAAHITETTSLTGIRCDSGFALGTVETTCKTCSFQQMQTYVFRSTTGGWVYVDGATACRIVPTSLQRDACAN